MVSKKQLLVSILIILTFSLVLLGGSYAYFSANVNGDPISNTVEAAMLGSVNFVAGPNVQVPEGGIFPGWIGVQEFSINKPADMNAGVGAFEILMDTTVDVAYGDWVTYEIYKTTDGDTITRVEGDLIISPEGFASQEDSLTAVGFNIPSSALKKGVMNNTTGVMSLHKENFDLSTYQDTTYYVVYRFNNEELDQSVAMGKEFSATIQVVPTVQFNVDVENMEMILAESTQYYEDLGVTPEPIDNFTYTEHLYHAEIVSYTGTSTDIVIPNEINGKPVTVIKSQAFYHKSNVTNFTFPSSLLVVENYALPYDDNYTNRIGNFYYADREMTYLARHSNSSTSCPANMVIPDGTKFIGNSICISANVSNLTIPEGVKYIGVGAFSSNELNSIILPDSLEYIGDGAFGSNYLTELVIPDNVKTIDVSAFSQNNITSLVLGEKLITIENSAFLKNKINSITFFDNLEYIGISAFEGNSLTSVVMPNSLKNIGQRAFFDVSSLASVTLNGGLEIIGDFAFSGTTIDTITIPSSVKSIGSYISSNNYGFSTVYIEGKDSIADFEDFDRLAFYHTSSVRRATVTYLGK